MKGEKCVESERVYVAEYYSILWGVIWFKGLPLAELIQKNNENKAK